MSSDLFDSIQHAAASAAPAGVFDLLIERFLAEKNYPLLFEARLMKKRHELGLPLVQTEQSASWPEDKQKAYDEAARQAARKVGELFLAEGRIERAWPYFRALGESAPIRDAIDQLSPGEGMDEVIQIALQEGVHPAKGLELLLKQHGMCRAITTLGMYAIQADRDVCIAMLVRELHKEVLESLQAAVERHEGVRPETRNIEDLIHGRDWLFGEYDYYVDTSHLISVVRYAIEIDDPLALSQAHGLCEYGKRLSSNFQFRGEPPFENVFEDAGWYLRGLLGNDVDQSIAHFRRKAAEADPDYAGTLHAQALIALLVALKRFNEAIDVAEQYLLDANPSELSCPSVLQLCYLAKDYERLAQIAKRKGDVLSYTAAALQRT